jgi:hypothetical protein
MKIIRLAVSLGLLVIALGFVEPAKVSANAPHCDCLSGSNWKYEPAKVGDLCGDVCTP